MLMRNRDRTPISSLKRFESIRTIRQLDDKFVLEHSSLDAYLYLRFLSTVVFICFVGVCITWPILLPVNATGGGDASQLDRLGFGNVHYKDRLYAHAVVAWVFYSFVMFVVARERMWLIGLRQAWYMSQANASRLSSRTVLYLDPPKDVSSDADAQSNFGQHATNKWIITPTKSLDDLVESRDDKTMRLEYAEVSFLKHASKENSKLSGGNDSVATEAPDVSSVEAARQREQIYHASEATIDIINHLRADVKEATEKVNKKRESYSAERSGSHGRSAIFVEYRNQSEAQRAYQGERWLGNIPVPPNLLLRSKLIGVVPNEIIWKNLAMPYAERLSKKSIANILIAALIIFWSIPTAIVGTISNLNYLASFELLHWIKTLPDPLLGLLTGLLPPLLTSMLAAYVPNLMRSMYFPTIIIIIILRQS